MATVGRFFSKSAIANIYKTVTLSASRKPKRALIIIAQACGISSITWLTWKYTKKIELVQASETDKKDKDISKSDKAAAAATTEVGSSSGAQTLRSTRGLRFLSFASVEYEGDVYMTPQDFLESLTEETPRSRSGRIRLSSKDVEKILYNTPTHWKGSFKFFRNLRDDGLITYSEYLFLICCLTKPKSGFEIAFNMFDTDGNRRVDKREFLMLVRLYETRFGRDQLESTATVKRQESSNIWDMISFQRFYPKPEHELHDRPTTIDDVLAEKSTEPIVNTTLLVHFFGLKGKDTLTYADFQRFYEDFQTEVLDLEYREFSHGLRTISEESFAKALLRYTTLTPDEHEDYLERLRTRVIEDKGIEFKDFRDFCLFLNNLDDFAIAMKMYAMANRPISEDEFKRAVKACMGQSLNDHLVHVVFQLFDIDGDGHLSHKEFIAVMKDRLHRGFKSPASAGNRWEAFTSCVKTSLKSA